MEPGRLADIPADVKAIGQIPIIHSLLEVVCKTTGMGFSAVARVTDERWIACEVRDEIAFGLKPGGELKLETTICNEIRQTRQLVVIDHVNEDPVYNCHPTPLMYGFQSYISVPIFKRDGSFFGTLCAIDPKPAKLNNPQIIGMFTLFADLVSSHLEAIDKLQATEAKLLEEKKNSELREQFIAILGHDLRNPIGSIMMGSEMLLTSELSGDNKLIAHTIKRSAYRMTALINNILDFANGRLGSGIVLEKTETASLDKMIHHVITELKTIWPNRSIDAIVELNNTVNADVNRLAQLFSNILGNALVHSRSETPISVIAFSNKKEFSLEVVNETDPISKTDLERLFQPFYRGKDKSGKQGLGLGLFIASEIAKAHDGEITATLIDHKISFKLTIPT